jgi:hypothetical protein
MLQRVACWPVSEHLKQQTVLFDQHQQGAQRRRYDKQPASVHQSTNVSIVMTGKILHLHHHVTFTVGKHTVEGVTVTSGNVKELAATTSNFCLKAK